jgi:hypothetical protein
MTTINKTINRKAQRNAYADWCIDRGLGVAEVGCFFYSNEPGGDPILWCESRSYEEWGVEGGYAIPYGDPIIGQPPKIRYAVQDMPTMALHWC